jgi:hypothetical protein
LLGLFTARADARLDDEPEAPPQLAQADRQRQIVVQAEELADRAREVEEHVAELNLEFSRDGQWFGSQVLENIPFGSASPTAPTIVLTQPGTSNQVAEILEDLTVMSRLLQKTALRSPSRDNQDTVLGLQMAPGGATRRPHPVYLQGYGALILASVRFPLLAPPESPEPEQPAATPENDWERTRRELYGRPNKPDPMAPALERFTAKISAQYDGRLVRQLKEAVLAALKNASHIRHLNPTDTIAVAITGPLAAPRSIATTNPKTDGSSQPAPAATPGPRTPKFDSAPGDAIAGERPDPYVGDRKTIRFATRQPRGSGNSTLTFTVRKADVDAAAKDQLTDEEFRKRVAIATY